MINQYNINIQITEYDSITELGSEERSLVDAAMNAVQRAYAPYSKFNVGAAVLLSNGEIVEGNNQENAAYPSGLCAERVACFYANSRFPGLAVISVAICAMNENGFLPFPIPPCGSCRQSLLETETRFKQNIKVILYGSKKIKVIGSIKELLPVWFDASDLNG